MKQIKKYSIENVEGSDPLDKVFQVPILTDYKSSDRKIIHLRDLLLPEADLSFSDKIASKPAMFANVFGEKVEYSIFEKIATQAIQNKEYIHITGLTLAREIEFLEEYYSQLGFFDEENNTYKVDFSIPYVTAGVIADNLIWKGSDYKAQRDNIFYCPPVRSSGENKALIKGITRGVICGIDFSSAKIDLKNDSLQVIKTENNVNTKYLDFLEFLLNEEKVFPIQFARVLYYNLIEAGFEGEKSFIEIKY